MALSVPTKFANCMQQYSCETWSFKVTLFVLPCFVTENWPTNRIGWPSQRTWLLGVLRCERHRVRLCLRKRRHLIEPNPKFTEPGFKVQAVTFAQIGNPRQNRSRRAVGFLGLGEERRSPGSQHIHQRKAPVEFPADENLQIVVGMVADRNEFSCAVRHAFPPVRRRKASQNVALANGFAAQNSRIVRVRYIRRKNIVFVSPNPSFYGKQPVSNPAQRCLFMFLRRRNRAAVSVAARLIYASRFTTPMASTIIRCISSAPTRAFRTMASCIGRNFRRSITLAKSSGVKVRLSASTLILSQSARPHFRAEAMRQTY